MLKICVFMFSLFNICCHYAFPSLNVWTYSKMQACGEKKPPIITKNKGSNLLSEWVWNRNSLCHNAIQLWETSGKWPEGKTTNEYLHCEVWCNTCLLRAATEWVQTGRHFWGMSAMFFLIDTICALANICMNMRLLNAVKILFMISICTHTLQFRNYSHVDFIVGFLNIKCIV